MLPRYMYIVCMIGLATYAVVQVFQYTSTELENGFYPDPSETAFQRGFTIPIGNRHVAIYLPCVIIGADAFMVSANCNLNCHCL